MLRFTFLSALAALAACTPVPAQAAGSCGTASFYSDEYAGRPTANGERFSPSAMTAAHPSAPFGSKWRVVNQGNGATVVVRINDRGPFVGGRIIDLSRGAFAQIASTGQGLARVCMARV
jgi:rare lipoprotein A